MRRLLTENLRSSGSCIEAIVALADLRCSATDWRVSVSVSRVERATGTMPACVSERRMCCVRLFTEPVGAEGWSPPCSSRHESSLLASARPAQQMNTMPSA